MGRTTGRIQEVWDVCQAEERVNMERTAASGLEDDDARRRVDDGFQGGREASTKVTHLKTHVRVVVHGDCFTFAPTDSELRKVRSRMCEWYDVRVRCILGSGQRNLREFEIVGRSLRWTENELVYEASDKTSPGTAGRIIDGQQPRSQARGDRARRRGNAGRSVAERSSGAWRRR